MFIAQVVSQDYFFSFVDMVFKNTKGFLNTEARRDFY